MKHSASVLLLILILLPSCLFTGKAQNCLIKNFSRDSGLSNNNVKAVFQDSDGFVWIGTRSGLDRYDGYNFEHMDIPCGDDVHPGVYSLFQDSVGRLWIASSAGLFYYSASSGAVHCFDAAIGSCGSVIGTSDGHLWVLERGGVLWNICVSDLSFRQLRSDCKYISSDRPSGTIYVATFSDSLLMCRNGDGNFVPFPSGASGQFDFGKIYSLNCASGKLVIGSLDGNFVLDLRTGSVSKNSLPLVNQLQQTPSGDIWMATKHGMYVLDQSMSIKESYFKDPGVRNSISDDYTISICSDNMSGIWVGTYFGGLSHLVPNISDLQHYFPGTNVKGSCNVREIVQDGFSTLWVGTNADGLYKLSVDGVLSRCFLNVGCNNILGLFVDGDILWIGLNSDHEPLLSMDIKTGKIFRHSNIDAKAYAFCKSEDGRLWIGCEDGLHIGRYADNDFVEEETLNIRHVRRIIKDTMGRMWVAGTSGVGIIDPSVGMTPSPIDISVDGYLSDIFEDSSGRMWLATDGGELLCSDVGDSLFQRVRLPSEYQCDKLFKISQDVSGTLWVTSNSGLLAIRSGNEDGIILVSNDELDISNFNYSSNYISQQGILYAGTTDGFVSLNPVKLFNDNGTGKIALSSLVVLNTLGGELKTFSGELLGDGGKITLPSNQNSFEIRVSDFDYSYPRTSLIMYQLMGYSDEWRKSTAGVIRISSLQSGKYTLRLKHATSDEILYVLQIEIKLPFVLTFPFFAILVVLIIAVVLLIVKVERKRAIVSARKAAAEESSLREVENEKRQYASKVEFLSSIAHEIRTPLMLISQPVKSLIDRLGKVADKSVVEDVEIIDRNAERLSSLIDELLDFGHMETAEYKLDLAETDVSAITRKVFDRFALSARKKCVDFDLQMPQEPMVFSIDRRMYEKLLGNLFSNALKYGVSYVRVVASIHLGDFVLSVTNDGEVVPLDQRTRIFKPFVRYTGSGVNPVPGTGIGLYTSANFVSMMGGSLEMDDDLSVNRFILSLPIIHQTSKAGTSASPFEGNGQILAFDTTLMLVEDDADMRLFLSKRLKQFFNVLSACDGREAQDLIERGEVPNIIVSDVIMPEVDGYELCKYVKGSFAISHIPVVLLTATTTEEARLQGLDVGADAYLQKPVSVEVLTTTVRNILQNRRNLQNYFLTTPSQSFDFSGLQSTDVLFLRRLQEFINGNLDNPNLKNEDIACAMCVSSSALFKKVKALTGMSPMEYLQRSRLNKAAELLSSGSMSITSVCYSSGFNTPSYFTMVFKRRFGMTPREWVDKSANR